MNSHRLLSVTVWVTVWFQIYSNVRSSCEYPFQPLTNPYNPKMFFYCNKEENSSSEQCPMQSTCEDLWLGLFVCCGYNTTTSNETTSDTNEFGKKLNRTEIKSLLLRNGKHIRMPHLEDQKSVTTSVEKVVNESLDEKNIEITKSQFLTTQTIPVEVSTIATHTTTTTTLKTTPATTSTSTNTAETTTITNNVTADFLLVNETTSGTPNGTSVQLENLTLDQESGGTGTTSLADFTNRYKASKDKRAELKAANGFRKENIRDSKSTITTTASQQAWNTTHEENSSTNATTKTTKKVKTYSILSHGNNSSKPQVFILQEGLSRKVNATSFTFPATITLIVDHGKTVIVDTGMPTDYETLGLFLIELNRYGVDANAVDVVVTTHGHPDHFGHLNLFPSAIQIFGGLIYVGSSFTVSDLYMNELAKLTENVSVYKTPGHTAEDVSVVVKNVIRLGTVSVVGDLFFSKDDITYPELWESQSWNVTLQNEYRHLLLCISDYIVPGHGRMFKVDKNMKKLFQCK